MLKGKWWQIVANCGTLLQWRSMCGGNLWSSSVMEINVTYDLCYGANLGIVTQKHNNYLLALWPQGIILWVCGKMGLIFM